MQKMTEKEIGLAPDCCCYHCTTAEMAKVAKLLREAFPGSIQKFWEGAANDPYGAPVLGKRSALVQDTLDFMAKGKL